MADYRVFFFDTNGHIAHPPKIVTCDTDGEALAKAAQELLDEHTVEVWEGGRLIAEIAPPRPL
jgi:hypothetical protein